MRFFLDNDVDAAVGAALRALGHECWTATQAGLSSETDDDLTVYASNHDAVLISHDREFAGRRRRNTIGRHVHLKCNEWDAATLIKERIDDLVPVLSARPDVLVEVSPNRVHVIINWD